MKPLNKAFLLSIAAITATIIYVFPFTNFIFSLLSSKNDLMVALGVIGTLLGIASAGVLFHFWSKKMDSYRNEILYLAFK